MSRGLRSPGASSSIGFVVALGVVLAIFLAFHLVYLPRSLEDLDSINFALGVRDFDVARHQPHPPGYPVFIALAKGIRLVEHDEARALALVSAIAGALGVAAIGALYRRIGEPGDSAWWIPVATALAVTSPLYWFSAARPLSDMAGLAAAVAVQAAVLAARSSRSLAAAACAAGLATGIRSQVAWLTLPLAIAKGLGDWGIARGLGDWRTGGLRTERRESGAPVDSVTRVVSQSPSPLVPALCFSAGALAWFIPLVVITGGPMAYWRALSNQGAEDFGNISMLWTTHNVRAAADALYFRLVAPWATVPVAALMIGLAVAGVAVLARRNRGALAILAIGFGPYAVFDLLFQETFTGRYALPLVVPVAFLAAATLRWLPRQSGLAVALVVAMYDAHVGGTSVAAFAREKAPAFRLLDDMNAAKPAAAPVLAMDRRNWFDFRRPLIWTGGATGAVRRLAAPPQHEWLEAVNYWNSGGRDPLWFVVDPKRAAIDLVQHGDPVRYRWPLPYPDLVSGARPNEMDWYRVERPELYVGEGWPLTPEAAGVADADRRGLAFGPIRAWIRRDVRVVMIGGRNLDSSSRTRLSVVLVGQSSPLVDDVEIGSGPFLMFRRSESLSGGVPGYYAIEATATPPVRLAIEQFDASADRALAGFGGGWHEPELNPRSGLRWRWLSARGELEVAPRGREPLTLHLEGESPRKYFGRGSRLSVRLRERIVFDGVVDDDFSIDVPLGDLASAPRPAPAIITIETDQTYVPAERSRRSQDHRQLGLRIFKAEIRPASEPRTAANSRPVRRSVAARGSPATALPTAGR